MLRAHETYGATNIATGVQLLSKEIYIKDNGGLTTTAPHFAGKRSVPLELRQEYTPAAFEGFLTRLRVERALAIETAMPSKKGLRYGDYI